MRSAMFLGVDAVLVNRKKACGLTPSVSKVSSGALEFMPVYFVKAVTKFLDNKDVKGYKIISTDINDEKLEILDKR